MLPEPTRAIWRRDSGREGEPWTQAALAAAFGLKRHQVAYRVTGPLLRQLLRTS